MHRRQGWIIGWLGGWIMACCGCAQWPAALHERAPDLSSAGGSRLEMAQMSERLGRADLAEKFYHDVLVVQPHHPVAHHRLAALASRASRWREADAHFRLARRGGPPNADLLTDVAYGQYQRRQMRAAERTLREALQADPQHAKSRSLLALVLNEQGRFREGLAEFRQAVRGVENRGGAPEVYGAAITAATPAPRPSARRTDVQLAAAGVRAVASPSKSSAIAPENADERRLAREEAPARSPDSNAGPAKPPVSGEAPKPSKPAAARSQDRVAVKQAPAEPPRSLDLPAPPIGSPSASKRSRERLAEPPVAQKNSPQDSSTDQRQPAARTKPERSVVIRIGASSLKELPTRAAAQGTALRASPASGAEQAADDRPKSKVQFKRADKHLAAEQASFEEPAEAPQPTRRTNSPAGKRRSAEGPVAKGDLDD